MKRWYKQQTMSRHIIATRKISRNALHLLVCIFFLLHFVSVEIVIFLDNSNHIIRVGLYIVYTVICVNFLLSFKSNGLTMKFLVDLLDALHTFKSLHLRHTYLVYTDIMQIRNVDFKQPVKISSTKILKTFIWNYQKKHHSSKFIIAQFPHGKFNIFIHTRKKAIPKIVLIDLTIYLRKKEKKIKRIFHTEKVQTTAMHR